LQITAFYQNPSVWGIGLAIIFGAIWIAALKPLNLQRPISWIILLVGAALFAPSIAWVQTPLQTLVGTWIIGSMGIVSYQNNLLWAGIPVVLLSGLVQEGAKLLPVVVYWWYKHREISPKLGLSIGAMAGAGFGVFEAQWLLNSVFAAGWNWTAFQLYGFLGIAAFVERFFTIAFHTASTALAGWGLAKGWGWQFYLLVSFLHFLVNYGVLLAGKRIFDTVQTEIWVYIISAALFGFVMWLRWRSRSEIL
jgi:hypothetical protein